MDGQSDSFQSGQERLQPLKTPRSFLFRRTVFLLIIALAVILATTWSILLSRIPPPKNSPMLNGLLMNTLTGVSAISADDIWAVGDHSSPYRAQTLTEHWDGSQWSIIPSPNMPSGEQQRMRYKENAGNTLTAVTALSHNDVWAVGYIYGLRESVPLVEHWDGTEWNFASVGLFTEAALSVRGRLYAVRALSHDNIWAVGSTFSRAGIIQPLIEHWDGLVWDLAPQTPCGQNMCILRALTALSANNIWAVGYSGQSTLLSESFDPFDPNNFSVDISVQPSVKTTPFLVHWDGKSWHVTSSPSLNRLNARLLSLSANTPDNIWAVGRTALDTSHQNNFSHSSQPLILHWDGTSWHIVPSPTFTSDENMLTGVVALAPGTVWAVGYSGSRFIDGTDKNASPNHTLVEQWDGIHWNTHYNKDAGDSPPLSPGGITALSATNVWVVGYSLQATNVDFGNDEQVLTRFEHWNGTDWRVVSGPNQLVRYPYFPLPCT